MGYKELKTEREIIEASKLIDAWKDPNIPFRQLDACVNSEMTQDYRKVPPFKAFKYAVDQFLDPENKFKTILEIGASSGYYGELLRRWGIQWDYTALDYNSIFEMLSNRLFPQNKFIIGDALNLPLANNSYDIVVSGCILLHIYNWRKAMAEAARVSKGDVIFHRTPILHNSPTRYFLKEGYGVSMLEIWFNRGEFEDELYKNKLEITTPTLTSNPVFENETEYGLYGHYTISTRKMNG